MWIFPVGYEIHLKYFKGLRGVQSQLCVPIVLRAKHGHPILHGVQGLPLSQARMNLTASSIDIFLMSSSLLTHCRMESFCMPWEISHKTIWPVLSLVPLNRKEICMSPSPDSDEDTMILINQMLESNFSMIQRSQLVWLFCQSWLLKELNSCKLEQN